MAKIVHWNGHVLRKEDGHVLRKAFEIEFAAQRKRWELKKPWKQQVEEEIMNVGWGREDTLC